MAVESRRARLVLPASTATIAAVEVERQPRSQRTTRALLILAVSLVLAPVLFFIPPHVVWPVAVLAAGAFLAYRTWVGEYVVQTFEGRCPRCGEAVELEPGTRIKGRHRVECYSCHREPELVLEEAGGEGSSGG